MQTEYTYEAFGRTVTSGVPSENQFLFAGREHDASDFYYSRFRYYAPGLHRFLSEDPLGVVAGLNMYEYARNNPTNFRDPLGLDVTVTLYPGEPGNPYGHIGVGVNAADPLDTIGHYAATTSGAMFRCATVRGEVVRDRTHKSSFLQTITISRTPQQDAAMNSLIQRELGTARPYNLCSRNCSNFVFEVLREGSVQVTNTRFPRELMEELQRRYGPPRPPLDIRDIPGPTAP